jgi:DsbC/DsbD-like thiol-disulfide interchange protein
MIAAFSLLSTTMLASAAGLSLPPPGWEPPPAVSFDGIPDTASKRPENQPGKPHQVHARLVFDRDSVEPGGRLRMGLHLEQDQNWHTYWKSPGDIGLPTEILWSTPPGVTVGPYEYPVPHKFDVQSIISYGYEGEVLLFTEMAFPADMEAGEYPVGLKANWLVCEVSCIPGSVELTSSVTVRATAGEPSAQAPLFEHAEAFHPGPLPDGVSVRGSVEPATVKPEQPFTVTLDVEHPGTVQRDETGWPFFVPIAGQQWMILETEFQDQPNYHQGRNVRA